MVSPLDKKLTRDLWRMKGQGFAIATVIAVGVLLLVMMDGLVLSLSETRDAYYERYRFADIYAPVKRAPDRLLKKIAEFDGVVSVEGRVVGGALIDIPGKAAPIRAQAVSLPDFSEPRLNAVYLAEGQVIDPRRHDEILLLKGFADAHGLKPGDHLTATMNGARRTFRIVGLAQAPEFLYTTAPGELTPDDSRFAVIWMGDKALAAAFDMDGAFNEALIGFERDANEPAILDAVDRLLDPYGGGGAYGRKDQFSNRFLTEEIRGLKASLQTVPPVFLGVAAFLLNIVVSRMIAADRLQIGLLKAFGYTSREVTIHYFKLVLVIAVLGAIAGCILGVFSGQALAGYYQVYYKFPFLIFRVDPAAFIIAVLVSIVAASAGALVVLRRVFAMTPSIAMRPPAPPDYSRSVDVAGALRSILDQPSRMVVRRLTRQPVRSLIAIVGIAAGMALSLSMLGVMAGFERAIDLNFTVVDRSDASVAFIEPLSDKTIFELKRMDGVIEVEPYRAAPVILRNGVRTHRGSITGLVSAPRLSRAISADLSSIYVRSDGIILAKPLQEKLGVAPGDEITVEVREGRRPTITVPVVAIAETLLGSPAYMELGALNRALSEQGRVSGAYMRIDSSHANEIYDRLKAMPAIAGVTLQREALDSIRKVMNEGAGATRYIMSAIAMVITFGIVFNSARIAFAERSHDLASLRVIGFTRGEAAFVLLGELAVITFLALPLGALAGAWLANAMAEGFSTDLYSIPAETTSASIGFAAFSVIAAAAASGLLVKRDIDRLDLVSALKARE